MKKFLSFLICTVLSFGIIGGFTDISPVDISISASAEESPVTSLQNYNYFYSNLSASEKNVYEHIYVALINCKPTYTIECTLNQNQMHDLLAMFFYDTPEFFNLQEFEVRSYISHDKKFKHIITLKYFYKKDVYDKMAKQATYAGDKILNKITDKMTDYDKIKLFHDELIETCKYSLTTDNNSNIYGAFIKKSIKCDGYARAMSYLCSRAGIMNAFITGEASDGETYGPHAWNKVVCDGEWYNVDVTFDDLNNKSGSDLSYRYFLINDELISSTHNEDVITLAGFETPVAEDESKDYYKSNNLYISKADEFCDMVTNEVIKQAKQGSSSITFKVSTQSLLKKADNPYVMCPILNTANKSLKTKLIADKYKCFTSDETLTFTLFLEYK